MNEHFGVLGIIIIVKRDAECYYVVVVCSRTRKRLPHHIFGANIR